MTPLALLVITVITSYALITTYVACTFVLTPLMFGLRCITLFLVTCVVLYKYCVAHSIRSLFTVRPNGNATAGLPMAAKLAPPK